MARITEQVLAFAAGLDATELPQNGHEQHSETLDLEVSQMRRAFGSLWEPILSRFGLERSAPGVRWIVSSPLS